MGILQQSMLMFDLLLGEEEADLGLAELIDKGEVAWLNASDANKEVDQPKSKYRDDFDEPGTSKGKSPLIRTSTLISRPCTHFLLDANKAVDRHPGLMTDKAKNTPSP